jgi:tRNA threonylcarbamoyladenosine biosynthesis protein TsaE
LLTALGVGERVKSPTYSLVEGYSLRDRLAWHLDLYRIADPGELEWLGLDALADPAALVLVEWPERGAGALPAADLELHLDYAGTGRSASWQAFTDRGERLLARLAKY